jgi:hypothetical protein
MFSASLLGITAFLFKSVQASRLYLDCSTLFSSTLSTSYFIPSEMLAWINWIPSENPQDFNTSYTWCSGAITSGTRLAVLKDANLAKEYISWMENWMGLGSNQNYIALKQADNALDANSNWTWLDGTNEVITSTYWADSQPSGGSCGAINA